MAVSTFSAETIAIVFTSLLTIFLLLHITKFRKKTRRTGHKLKAAPLPPGPTPWPVVGCIPQMLCQGSVSKWIHHFMKEMNVDIACFKLGNVHVIPVTSPTIAREFLRKHDAIFASRPVSMSSRILSGGYRTTVMTPYGEGWKKMKRVLSSQIVSPERHQWLHDKRAEEADNLVRYLYYQSKKFGIVNIRTATRQYSGNVIRRLIFNKRYFGLGRDDGGPTFMELEHVDALFTALKYVYSFCVSDFLPILEGLDLDGHEKIVKEAHKIILKYHEPIINERIKKWRDVAAERSHEDDESEKMEIEDLLDVLISLKNMNGEPLLTRREITAQITEIMLAAIDNPPNAVEWAMAEMISKPEILNRAVEELDKLVGKDRLVQEQDIPNLNYIKSCAREAFRLHPVVPFNVPHVSQCDAVVAGYYIPKGSHVLLSRLGLGQNPKVWDNPLEFKPERHLPDNYNFNGKSCSVSLLEPDLKFISFSTGRRRCAGTVLGSTMMVMLLARMVQGFSWKAAPNASKIKLEESKSDLSLCQPLVASLEPRLPPYLYPL